MKPMPPPKAIHLPTVWRVTSELRVNFKLYDALLMLAYIRGINYGMASQSTVRQYMERLTIALAWVHRRYVLFPSDHQDWMADRDRLSQWEAYLALTGCIASAQISIKNVLIHSFHLTVPQSPTGFTFSHKLTGSVVGTSLIAQSFIDSIALSGLPGYEVGVRPLIEQVHRITDKEYDTSTFPDVATWFINAGTPGTSGGLKDPISFMREVNRLLANQRVIDSILSVRDLILRAADLAITEQPYKTDNHE